LNADKLSTLDNFEKELTQLKSSYEAAEKVERLSKDNEDALKASNKVNRLPIANTESTSSGVKSLGQVFVESEAYKNFRTDKRIVTTSLDINMNAIVRGNLKNVFSEGAGYAPFVERSGVVAYSAQRQPVLLDVLPTINTDQSAYKFMLETTFTNNAAPKAESAQGALTTFGESALAFTEETAAIKRIGTFLPITDEQIEDVAGIVGIVDNRLGDMIRLELETQVLAGDGTGANILGLENLSGVQTYTLSSETDMDAIFKGITKVRANAFVQPDYILINPTDWQTITLTKDTLGQYILHAAAIGGPATLWGLPVIMSTAVTAGTCVVINSASFAIVMRRGLDVQMGYVNANFTQGVKTLRADLRAGFVGYRPSAACVVTL